MRAAHVVSTTDEQEGRPLFHQSFKAVFEEQQPGLPRAFVSTSGFYSPGVFAGSVSVTGMI